MNDSELDALLKQELDSLDQEISPERNLYSGIEHAINGSRISLKKYLALAASVMLAVGLVFSSGFLFRSTENTSPELADLITFLQAEHERNIETLLVEFQDQQALVPDWELQMEQLQQAEDAIYDALKSDPTNFELLKILRQVQAKQINLIDAVYAPNFMII